MISFRYLTTEELASFDPTGKARQKIVDLQSEPYRNGVNPYISSKLCTDKALANIVDTIDKTQLAWVANRPDRLKWYEWMTPARDKIAPQGGRYEWDYLICELSKYYEAPNRIIVRPSRVMDIGMHILLNTILQRMSQLEGSWNYEHSPILGTLAGLPTMAKKGTYTAETAFKAYSFRHLIAAVPGERVIKNKRRVIFNDANSNVRMVEGILAYARSLLKRILPEWFHGWLNPNYGLRESITKALVKHWKNIETDQTAMDQHFTRGVVERYIMPIYKVLLPPCDYDVLAVYVSEMFNQELFLGDRVFTGEHAMFSGQPPTNDFETIVQLMNYLGAVHEVLIIPRYYVCVNGDDAGLLVDCSADELKRIHELLVESFGQLGFELSIAKSRMDTGDFSFCKKYYAECMPRIAGTNIIGGGYSPYYSVNSIFYPEKNPCSHGIAHVSALQILDNLEFTPAVSPVLDWANRAVSKTTYTQADIDYVCARDWWFKVYGEHWKPESSWAWHEILKRNS